MGQFAYPCLDPVASGIIERIVAPNPFGVVVTIGFCVQELGVEAASANAQET
jgi:hypothetical protein